MRRNLKAYHSPVHLKEANALLRSLAHPLRMDILQFIDEHPNEPAGAIYHKLRIEQSICSQHLRILKSSWIISADKEFHNTLRYKIDYNKVEQIVNAVNNFLGK